ncbi:MAG: putative signal transducing protein [Bacteroidales bacterium]
MGKEEQLIHLYTGSQINAISIKEFLQENGIVSFVRNDHHSGNLAGFGAALPDSGTSLFVKKKDYMEANVLVNRYIDSIFGSID